LQSCSDCSLQKYSLVPLQKQQNASKNKKTQSKESLVKDLTEGIKKYHKFDKNASIADNIKGVIDDKVKKEAEGKAVKGLKLFNKFVETDTVYAKAYEGCIKARKLMSFLQAYSKSKALWYESLNGPQGCHCSWLR
jgi:hypothetical protein